ncbi:MAG: glutathione S-transferase, partial [Pseudomonadota bacterium]|nr:glutathione S-transferase [Pseudomonadota bacterium]
LRHHDIPFAVHRIPLFTETMRTELADRFSNYKVPVLLDGELEIWDSLAILEYLAERYPETHGLPEDRAARAVARSVSAEMHSSFAALRNSMHMNSRRRFPGFPVSEAVQKDIDRIQTIWNRCRGEHGGENPWLFGRFSIADCMYAPVVMRFKIYDVALTGAAGTYADHLYSSPAIREWIANAQAEAETIDEEEVDWPGEPI